MSIFSAVETAPSDPILGLNDQFKADTNPSKVNLGVGVYFDAAGKLPLLQCVQAAEKIGVETASARGYQPIDGSSAYKHCVQQLVFGANSAAVADARVASIQTLGGTGGLKVCADFLKNNLQATHVLVSNPSWENHRTLFTRAGFQVANYRYYDPQQAQGIDFEGFLADLQAAPAKTVVVLHACCHNPTGYDITPEQWQQVIDVVQARGLIALLDMAYQGFANGIEQDGAVIKQCIDAGLRFFVANSFSKNFGLYGERVGALHAVCQDADEAKRVLSQLKITVRTNYSNPPTHGGAIVTTVLNNAELRQQWEQELTAMRERIKTMRQALVEGLVNAGVQQDMSFITRQIGMFSYSGLSKAQMQRLRDEFSMYGTDTGRMCVAALNHGNIDYVCKAIAQVL